MNIYMYKHKKSKELIAFTNNKKLFKLFNILHHTSCLDKYTEYDIDIEAYNTFKNKYEDKELVEYELCPGDNRARKTVSIMGCVLTNMTSELSDKLEDNIDVVFSFNIFKLKRKYIIALCRLGFHNTLVNVVGSDVLDNMLNEGCYELYELGEYLDRPYIIDDYMIDDIKELIYWYDNNDIGHLLLDYDIMCDKSK